MRGGTRKGLAVAIGATLGLAFGATQASGLGIAITAGPGQTFGATEYTTAAGVTVGFVNNDDRTHNVTADDKGPDGKALFRSGNVSAGDSAEVAGIPFVDEGDYVFHCTIHPDTMEATLHVNGGTPLARPEIDVAVKSKKLAKVVKSGKLKVEVSAAEPTRAEGVSISAKKGRKVITRKANLTVNAGNSETAKLKLKKKAAEKLADLDKAKVKVTGEVDFGSPAKASRKLK
jgi:plastocyanin